MRHSSDAFSTAGVDRRVYERLRATTWIYRIALNVAISAGSLTR